MLLAPNFTERLKYLFEEVQKRSILFKALIFFISLNKNLEQ